MKKEIQKATLKATPEVKPNAIREVKPIESADGVSNEPKATNLEKQLNKIEMTENQLQNNIFNELNHQITEAQKTMAQILAHLEMLHLLQHWNVNLKIMLYPYPNRALAVE